MITSSTTAPRLVASQRSVLRAYVLVGLAVPAVIAVVTLVLQLSWLDELPATVATHWGFDGTPDGFSTPQSVVALTPLLTLGLPVLLAGTALPAVRRGARGPNIRLLAALALALSLSMALLMTWTLAVQRGLEDPAQAPGIGAALLWSYGIGIGAGVLGWFAQPYQERGPQVVTPGADVPLAAGESAVWIRSTAMSPWAIGMFGVLTVGLGALAISILTQGEAVGWLVMVLALGLAGLMLTMSSVSTHVSGDGFSVHGTFGWPRRHVALADVVSVRVAEVNAMADFGGWGWRLRSGALGIVMRSGEALWVERKGERDLVVVVDDAAVGAGLLQALVARDAGPVGSPIEGN